MGTGDVTGPLYEIEHLARTLLNLEEAGGISGEQYMELIHVVNQPEIQASIELMQYAVKELKRRVATSKVDLTEFVSSLLEGTPNQVYEEAGLPGGGVLFSLRNFREGVPELEEPVTVDVYTTSSDRRKSRRLLSGVAHLVELIGLEKVRVDFEKEGSWFTRIVFRVKSGLTREDVAQRLVKVERALEIGLLDLKQAEVDRALAEALHEVMQGLEENESACIRLGTLLIIRIVDASSRSVVLSRSLSQREVKVLEQYPEIQQRPEKVLSSLAFALSQEDEALESGS